VLSESALESRLAFGNGFLGMRADRSVSRGPTWGGLAGIQQMGILAALLCTCPTPNHVRAMVPVRYRCDQGGKNGKHAFQ
jgi:hypothetical protein